MAAQAQYVDDDTLAARQAARRAATAAAGTPSGGWNPAADVPSIAPAPVQAVPNPATSRYGIGGNAAIDAKVDQIGQRARAFRQQVQASDISAQVGRAPGLQPGAPTGPSSSLDFRQAGNITPSGPSSQIPSIQPQTVTTTDMARAAPDSAFARRNPGAIYDQPGTGTPLSSDELARMQRGAARVAGTNTATAAGTAAPQGPGFSGPEAPSGAGAAVADAAPGAAQAAESAATGVVGRVGSAARSLVGRVGRGLGYLAVAGEGVQAVSDARNGNYGDAATNGLLATSDALATRVPTPWTIGAAVAGHATQAALDTQPGQNLTRSIANGLPGSGAKIADQAVADLQATMADRQRRGLPIPADYQQALEKMQGYAAGIRGNASPNVGPATDLISPGSTDRSRQQNEASILPSTTPTSATDSAASKVGFTDPYASGVVGPPGRDGSPAPTGAEIAMRSNLPGTAVINGRVLTPNEIDDAGKRLNTVSSSAFTNAPSGVLYTEANGGIAPTSEQVMAMRARSGQSGPAGGGMGNGAQWDDRAQLLSAQQQRQVARDKEMNRLTSMSESALAHGRKRAAAIFANLAGQYGGNTDYSPYLPAQARPNTPEEAALLGAQAENYQANAAESMSNAQRRQQIAAITDRIGQTTDPKQRAALEAQANAMNGRADLNRAYKVDLPTQDVDANGVPVKLQMLVSPDGTVIFDPRGTMTGKNINQQKPQGS